MESVERGERVAVRPRLENSSSTSTSGRLDGRTLRDELADIGESIKKLQEKLSTLPSTGPAFQPPPEVLQELWSLLWQLRPFLFLASPATARQWPLGSDVFSLHHRRHYAKDAGHVAIALRLYVVLLRFTVVCPAAAVHGCLTLLSVFAVLNDARLRSWRDSSERVQDVFLFLLRALHTSEPAACARVQDVMRQLLSEVTVHFQEASPDDGAAGQPSTALFLELSVPTTPALLEQSQPLMASVPASVLHGNGDEVMRKTRVQHDIFSAHVCVETSYEARCIQAGLLQLLVRLVEQKVVLHVPRDHAVLLCDVACHLVSSAVPGAEGGVVNRVQHETAWYALRFLTTSHLLLAHVHGPLLLSLLTAQWQSTSAPSIYDMTLAERAIFEWLAHLTSAEWRMLASAMERKGQRGGRPASASPLTLCLTQMWEVAVRWCLELFTCPTCASTTASVQQSGCALQTLATWVSLCEGLFNCSVQRSCTLKADGTDDVAAQQAEHAHRLQLLANELPLSSWTAALLCTQMPQLTTEVADAVVFLPHRILSFFAIPALPVYITAVVEEAKNRVDVSAFRLVEANALSILATTPVAAVPHAGATRCGAAAFHAALGEVVQVVQHHERPSYPFLLQAAIVLLHFYPRDSATSAAAEPSEAKAIPRKVQELEAALAARLPDSLALPGVSAPLWHLLYKNTAAVLFRVGSGLSWTRRALQLPTFSSLPPGSSGLETCLGRIAGITEALREAFTRALMRITDALTSSQSSATAVSAFSAQEREEEKRVRLRRAYESLTNLLSVSVQLFSVLETVLRHVERCAPQWCGSVASSTSRGDAAADALSSMLLTASALFTSAAALQLQLLEAKYTFACIAGSHSEAAQIPAKETRISKSRSRGRGRFKKNPKKQQQPASAATISDGGATAVVVDVDDDEDDADDNRNEDADEHDVGSGSNTKERHHLEEPQDEEEDAKGNRETALPSIPSKTQLLERIVYFHRTQLLPAVLSAVHAVVFPRKQSSRSSGSSTGPLNTNNSNKNDKDKGQTDNTSKRAASETTTTRNAELTPFCSALLRVAYTTVAFAPPHEVEQDVRACFSLQNLAQCGGREQGLSHTVVPIAAREMLMWSSPDRSVASSFSTNHKASLFLQWLAASDKVAALLHARSDALSSSVVEESTQDVIDLLRLVRRCMQDVAAATAATFQVDDDDLHRGVNAALCWTLSETVARQQEACYVASEFVMQEARGWIALCFDLYNVYRTVRSEAGDAALAVMGLCVETARDAMTLFAWSATDLLRFRERPFVFSSFFKAVVDKEDRDMKVVLTASLDVLGRYVISADGVEGRAGSGAAAAAAAALPTTALSAAGPALLPGDEVTRTRLRRLLEREGIKEWSSAAGALAYVLYECSGKPLARQLQYLGEVMGCLGKTITDVPATVSSVKHVIAFHLVSLEADAQLLAREQRRRSGRERRSLPSASSSTAAGTATAALSRLTVDVEVAAVSAQLGPEAHRLFFAGEAASGENGERSQPEESTRATVCPREPLWVLPSDVDAPDNLDSIAFSVFERAVEQMVTLCESADTAAAVESSLRQPVGRIVAAEELWKSMFAVLDSIYKAICIEPVVRNLDDGNPASTEAAGTSSIGEENAEGAPGSLRTRRRWLLGLASFIRFMGPQTTPIALMLPTLLERCSQLPGLVPYVCIVWKELVCACTEEYLAQSAPSIALSLVSLERHAAPQAESRTLLASALHHLYQRTESAGFWEAYKVVLGTSSELVQLVLQSRQLDEESRPVVAAAAAATPAAEDGDDLSRASSVLAGFVEVMRSGSLQSTTVFVRALYRYLNTANTAKRLRLSRAAAQQPAVVQTLLRCSEADAESVVYAMRCISILGAVTTPASDAAANAASAARRDAAVSGASASEAQGDLKQSSTSSLTALPLSNPSAWTSMTGGQSAYLDAETVLNWRKFAFTLLRDYFPHVFASTADPVLHNCIAFAVQELIRASTTQERLLNKGVKLRESDVVHVDELERYLWWAQLTPHVKQLLGGFTTTRYSLTVNWKARLRAPEYTPSLSYRRWLFNFFNHLVASCEGWFAEMVRPLRNVAKRNSSLILYLLPYLVVHLLELGSIEHEQYLECEMKTVLEAVVGGSNHATLSLRSQSLYESHPDTTPLHEPREHAHTVLAILEDVEQLRWSIMRHRGRVPCTFDQQEQSEGACIHLADRYANFVRLIPWTLRCRAGLKIGSHIRALRSVEGQRRIPDLTTVIGAVPLQRIFAALGDRESSRSIHRASPGLSLEDTAFSFENNGDWLAALGSSELVLQHRPSSGQHQLTALHCMNELGELYMTSRYAASLLAAPLSNVETVPPEVPIKALGPGNRWRGSTTFSQLDAVAAQSGPEDVVEQRSHVQAYANEAAWRLGQWESLLPDALTSAPSLSYTAPADGDGSGGSVSLAMPAAYLQRELTGRCALPRVHAATDAERLKIVPLVRTPCQEDLTTQGYTFTLLLHALGDVDAVSDLLCANISILDGDKGSDDGVYCLSTGDALPRGGTYLRSHSSVSNGGAGHGRSTPSRISAALLPSAVKDEIMSLLSTRAAYVEDTISAREPLLALHRMVYRELGVPQKVAETWLQQSQLLRNAGLGEAALTAARQAAYECPDHIVHTNYYTLVANLLHDTQSATPAIEFARECVNDGRIPATTRAQVQMLLTDWLVETGSERPERVFAEYNKARELDRRSELVHYQMAVFNDRLHTLATNASEAAAAQLTTATSSPVPGPLGLSSGGDRGGNLNNNNNYGGGGGNNNLGGTADRVSASTAALYSAVLQHQREMVESIHKYALHAIQHFGEALLRGTEKASVSLPRMLTLWLDSAAFLGSLMNTTAGKLDGSAASTLEVLNQKVRTFILSTTGPTIPPGVVMTALPQLLSRLAHPVPSVRTVLTDVVVHLLNCFPQQCLWLVLPMVMSKEGPREIVETQIIVPFASNARNERVLRYAKIICDTLLAICNCSASLFPRERGLTQLSQVEKINPMLPAARFVLPILSNLTPDINADELAGVFPTSPCFDHFEDRVAIMRSLQKPKRIWVATSEGREMSFLCKAKDEPRKDIRMMEVATLMNSFFLSDPEARRKRFSLRRYSVTALSDDCAVIEWMNNTSTLAKAAQECYLMDRTGVSTTMIKKWLTLVDEKKISKRELFTKYILPDAPPVLHQWLDRTFASNQSWYEARNLFTQSAALWSIAGHIVGLGDRHAENLMLDLDRGEVMHVDFACMFDKGELLEVPEQVRFRLTQNVTDAMGVLGPYGPFQATCEVALRCEMKNKSAVMSIVETLLHEPLVEWRRLSGRANTVSRPQLCMERVARRLDGFLDLYSVPAQRDTLALNVESQVSKLIHHSSDLDNLSQMYIWWMAWI